METILTKDTKRKFLFPIVYEDMWQMYRKSIASFWTVDEVDLSKDMNDWKKLDEKEKFFYKTCFSIFCSQ